MSSESLVPAFERPFLNHLKNWSEQTLTLTLLLVAVLLVWIALKKDHAVLKAVLLTYIFLP